MMRVYAAELQVGAINPEPFTMVPLIVDLQLHDNKLRICGMYMGEGCTNVGSR